MTSRFVLDQPADDTDMQHTHLEQKILLCNESRLILMFEEVLQTFGAELGNGLSNSSTRLRPKKESTRPHVSYNLQSSLFWDAEKVLLQTWSKGSDSAIH